MALSSEPRELFPNARRRLDKRALKLRETFDRWGSTSKAFSKSLEEFEKATNKAKRFIRNRAVVERFRTFRRRTKYR